MLLLDDDDELPMLPEPSEATLVARLGSKGIEAIDAVLLGHTRRTWLKVARVVFDGLRAGGFPADDDVVYLHVRRIAELVRTGQLESQGNLRRPRFSEVRLPLS
jgi:hypothetical protein